MADQGIDRRGFLTTLGVGAAITLVPFASGAYGKENSMKMSESEMKAMKSKGQSKPYTREDPGPWTATALIDAHIPRATLTKLDNEGNYRVDLVVHHPMNPQQPHWIEDIALKDDQDRILAERYFLATDPKPVAMFTANVAHVKKFKAYDLCNIHGLWLQEYQIPS